jgi:D-serine dehydratase
MSDVPLLSGAFKGYPVNGSVVDCSGVSAFGWNVLAGDLPLPVPVLKLEALESNLSWMQRFAESFQVDLAPHGKTTMSPQIFRRQLNAGAWGMTFASVHQLAIGVAAGVRNAIVAQQLVQRCELEALQVMRRTHSDLQVLFLVDSLDQLCLVDQCAGESPFDVLLEVGVVGGRTGCRSVADAVLLGRRVRESRGVRLRGVECYEGLGVGADTAKDIAATADLMDRLEAVVHQCHAENLFAPGEVFVSAGGSAIFDLVVQRLRPRIDRPVRGILRSGCYIVHDHGFYGQMLGGVAQRRGLACSPLKPALEIWTHVVSVPEPGLAILAAGKRDLSFDLSLPVPIACAAHGARKAVSAHASWSVAGMNDHHTYLRCSEPVHMPVVGERVALGISHPCTTFDKWRWMPVVDESYNVVDAITTHF